MRRTISMYEAKYQKYITNSNSRFSEPEEILAHARPLTNTFGKTASGIPLYYSSDETLYVDNEDNHTLVVGPTGCKKSRVTVFTTLATIINAGESAVVNDPKGEIYRKTVWLAKKKGAKITVLNFRKPLYSDSWNPLAEAYILHKLGKTDEAIQCVNDFVESVVEPAIQCTNDRYWGDTVKQFLTGVILTYMDSVPPEYFNITNIMQLCLEENSRYLKDILLNMDHTTTAAFGLHSVLDLEAEKTKSCVYSTLMAVMQPFTQNSGLMKMLSGDVVDFQSLSKKQSVIYLIYPDEKNNLSFLVNLFLTQCYETLVRTAFECEGDRLPLRVNFLLDEFSNLTPISNFDNRISEARSKNIRYFLFIQSFCQLKQKYKNNAETIISNCNNWICFSSTEMEFLEKISRICGNEVDYNGNEHPLLSPFDMQHFQKTDESVEVLIIKRGLYPFVTALPDYEYLSLFNNCKEESVNVINSNTNAKYITFEEWIREMTFGKFRFPFPKNKTS